MNTSAAKPGFGTANPHALATVLEAGQTRSIIASRDIFDVSGFKLWARDRPVSQELQRKLADRELARPLESCLAAENGVSAASLTRSLQATLSRDGPLAAILTPHATELEQAARQLPLHSVAQLLLTVTETTRPEAFVHAIEAMALNGAFTLARRGDSAALRRSMLSGLLHDLGEMYIAPHYGEADADRELDLESYQQLVVHPHIGRLLIEQLTDYPASVARAIAEHHERLDGSGYPHRLQRDQISPEGRQLAITEATLAALRGGAGLARASVALRVVPGEFDLSWAGEVARAARLSPVTQATRPTPEIQQRVQQLDLALQVALDKAQTLSDVAETDDLRGAFELARFLLKRLRTGWNASGLWSREAVADQDVAEIEAVEDELVFRLRAIERAARLRAGELHDEDAQRLDLLCEDLARAAA